MYDVLVIGGGAAGMFAAITAAEGCKSVALLEKNERLGKKLYITGKGRCNLTNRCSCAEALQNIPRNSRFLYSAMSCFSPEDTIAFFEERGCALKTERGRRVFPQSDKSASVIDTLRDALRSAGVQLLHAEAKALLPGADFGVQTGSGLLHARSVIVCTGGCSYPSTGSTGDGYRLVSALGHTIVPPTGSLVPLVEDGGICKQLQGLSLRNVGAALLNSAGKTVHEEFGELLFTHFGLSGPIILSMSAHMRQGERYTVSLDLKPALDEQKLDERLLRDFSGQPNKSLENVLGGLFPRSLIPVMLARSEIPGSLPVNAVTRAQRHTLLTLTKHFSIPIAGLRPVEEAIITSGGVKVSELNPKTMESKLIPGLYFAGEIIDCDGYTGGFNLQIAWATARAAGLAAGNEGGT